MRSRWRPGLSFALACLLCAVAARAGASERHALVVTGASGGPAYVKKYDAWRQSFVTTLRELGYPGDHVVVLAEEAAAGIRQATRENVRQALAGLRSRTTKDDVVLILLIGHGTGDDADMAKFNLVGPDLTAAEWADMIRPFAAQVVFVDTASGSFPFLEKISGRNRIVLTANDSAAQQFETVFPGYFINAFGAVEADLDKNGKVSLWEAFSYASGGVRRWFQERGQLATERALLDDSGDGVGRDVDGPGQEDGLIARVTYLQPDEAITEAGDAEIAALLRRRAVLETELAQLRVRKSSLPAAEYDAALERTLLEIARIDRRIRTKS